jgi:hypothetical protein
MIYGDLKLPLMDGTEISNQVFIIGEPRPVIGTNKLRCLVNYHGQLATAELVVVFKKAYDEGRIDDDVW